MKTNFTQRYAKRYYLIDKWATSEKKGRNYRKTLRKWAKIIRRKAENIIAPIKIVE